MEHNVPNFDELKDPAYNYHYSREERIRMRRVNFPETKKGGKVLRLFGYNKVAMTMFFFYIFLGLIYWSYVFFYHRIESGISRKVFHFKKGNVKVRLINGDNRKGLNVMIAAKDNWNIRKLVFSLKDKDISTNINITLNRGEVNAFFISIIHLTNISGLTLKME